MDEEGAHPYPGIWWYGEGELSPSQALYGVGQVGPLPRPKALDGRSKGYLSPSQWFG